jgi:DNA repair exonuclease SbcCD ATPase subunit
MAAEQPAGNGFTPEESLLLRAFVRRTVGPWLAGVCALAGLALAAALAGALRGEPAPPATGIAAGELAAAATRAARGENAALREEIAELRRRVETAAQAAPAAGASDPRVEAALRALEARLRGAFEPRVAELEAALARRAGAGAPRASAAPFDDLDSVRERIYNLELRLDDKDRERAALQKDLLARLYAVERAGQSESSARLENLRVAEERLERLERRLFQLEERAASPATPAAPAVGR